MKCFHEFTRLFTSFEDVSRERGRALSAACGRNQNYSLLVGQRHFAVSICPNLVSPASLPGRNKRLGGYSCQILSPAFGFAFAAAGGERKTKSTETKLLRLRVAANLVHLPGKPAGVQSGAVQLMILP